MSLPPTSRFDHGDETDPFDADNGGGSSKPPGSNRFGRNRFGRNGPAWIILGAAVVLLVVVIAVVVGTGGGDPATPAAPSTVTVERTVAPTTTTPPSSAVRSSTAPPTTSVASGEGIMPNVVCMNLQAAQDQIQKTGVFYSRSRDATGRGRSQLLDRNWIVVSQSPPAGTRIGEGDAVLSVVKADESNDC